MDPRTITIKDFVFKGGAPDIHFVFILDRKNKALYSRVLVDEKVKASIPKPQILQPLTGRNGLDSCKVVVMDFRTIIIKDFLFKEKAPDN